MQRGKMVRSVLALVVLMAVAVFFWLGGTEADQQQLIPSAAPSAGGASIQVRFSPPPLPQVEALRGGADAELARAIGQAESEVAAALYDLNLWSVRDALIAAHQRGLDVRLVMESDQADRSEVIDLIEADIPIHFDERPHLMHHKFIVIDGRWVWTGSMNWTLNGVYRNNNDLLIIDSTDMAENYLREFEEMYQEDRFSELSRPDTPFPFLVVGEAAVETAFSPDDNVAARILRSLERAGHQIDIMAFAFTSDPLTEALLAAHERGVQVRGVFEAARIGDLGSDVERLRAAGLPIRLDTNPNTMHHKAILIDGRLVITGSYNFTRSAEERNDENILFIDDEAVSQLYLDQFEALYQAAIP